MNKKIKSTYDELVESLNQKEKEEFEQDYQELILSELMLAIMEEDEISVRKLAKAAGVSPTIVQGLRSGTRKNVTLQSFLKVIKALGGKLILEKDDIRLPLDFIR